MPRSLYDLFLNSKEIIFLYQRWCGFIYRHKLLWHRPLRRNHFIACISGQLWVADENGFSFLSLLYC